MIRYLVLLLLTLPVISCSSHSDPAVTRAATPLVDCYTPVPPGAIVGFGVNGQPRGCSRCDESDIGDEIIISFYDMPEGRGQRD